MQKKFKNQLPNWYKDLNNAKLMLSNDIDSLSSCYVLSKLFNCEIKAFYDFKALYLTNIEDKKEYIGVDIDATNQKARVFGNHVTYFKNDNAISLNRDITRNNYTKKFAGSTLITIMSLYDIDISQFTTEQLEVLISIDTAFKQYFFDANLFKKWYIDILEYPEFVDIVQRHDKEYFYKIIRKYKLHELIHIDDEGYLYTNIDLKELSKLFNINLELPKVKFYKVKSFTNIGIDLNKNNIEKFKNRVFSNALTNKNFVKLSVA